MIELIDTGIRDENQQTSWYRNSGSKVYHKAHVSWVRTGKAVCGRIISSPGFVARNLIEVHGNGGKPCKDCLHKMRGRQS